MLRGGDGARSTTREHLGIGFPGGTYEHLFYVADVQATGETVNGDLNIAFERSDFLVVFPLKGEGRARFIGTVREVPRIDQDLSWEDVNKGVVERLRTDVKSVNWFSTYRVHHRVADRFREGRSFLLGDAAHVHGPVGGQGMNTGIGDAVNLAWKLAAVQRGRAKVSLLDTYEPERIAFARRLVATTDRAFTTVTSASTYARLMRLRIVPILAPWLFSSTVFRRILFRTISRGKMSTTVESRSQLRFCQPSPQGCDRLPSGKEQGLGCHEGRQLPHAEINSDWQPAGVWRSCARSGRFRYRNEICRSGNRFPWRYRCSDRDYGHDALYLVRPDGYVAVAADSNCAPRNCQIVCQPKRVSTRSE